MECEGGQQEEEEQSESSEGDIDYLEQQAERRENSEYSLEEGENSEEDNGIKFRRTRTLVTIKDIDKEFWRILHSYRPEIDNIQQELKIIRNSIQEN